MKTMTIFDHHLARVRRWAYARTAGRFVLCAACAFLGGCAALTIVRRVTKLSFDITPAMYGGLAAGAAVVAAAYVLLTGKRLLSLLIEIDGRLKLRDRLSTAYEYQTRAAPSEFLPALVDDAGRRLSTLHRRQVFPFAWSRQHLVLALLLALNGVLFGLEALLPKPEAPAPLNPQVSEQIRSAIDGYLQKTDAEAREPDKTRKPRTELQQQLEQIARQLEEQQMTRQQALEAVRQNLREIRSRQDQLTDALTAGLKTLDALRELPLPNMSQLPELSALQLNKIQKMLREALGGELPQNMRDDLELLRQYEELKDLLENLDDRLANPGEEGDGMQHAQEEEGEMGSEGAGDGESMMSQPGQEYAPAPTGDMASDESRKLDRNFDGQRMQGLTGEDSEHQPDSSGPGRSPGDGRTNPPGPIEPAAVSPRQDRMAPAKKAEYNAHIRSVTTIGEAAVPEEDVGRPYRREVEQVLHKEELPANYRDYIKTYFLSIGLTSEGSEE